MEHPSTGSGQVTHAYVLEAGAEEGLARVETFIENEFGMKLEKNPDIVVLKYGLLGVEDARRIGEIAMQGPIKGDKKIIVISASRLYHEAQNALLKLFEEPPQGTILFLILPTLGGLLPTLLSRVAVLGERSVESKRSGAAEAFLKLSKDKRSAYIKKLGHGKDEEERREHRDDALLLVNSLEQMVYGGAIDPKRAEFLKDIALLRGYMYDRSAPVRMILEHLALTIPKGLK